MGQEATKAIESEEGLELVGQSDLGDDLSQLLIQEKAQVVVDFTSADAVFENTKNIINAGNIPIRPAHNPEIRASFLESKCRTQNKIAGAKPIL